MKKVLWIIAAILVLGLIIVGVNYEFGALEKENSPYMSNKAQMLQVFSENRDMFEAVAESLSASDKDYALQYSLIDGRWSAGDISNEPQELQNQLLYLTENLQMTDIWKDSEYIRISQVRPISMSDFEIGVLYHISTQEWSYYYMHDEDCRHKHKVCYGLYDILYNRQSIID